MPHIKHKKQEKLHSPKNENTLKQLPIRLATFLGTIDMVTRQTDKNECRARDSNSRDKLIRNSHLMAAQAYKGHEWS